MGTKLSARIDKQDENIRNIHMSQMSLEKQVAQVVNSLNLRPKIVEEVVKSSNVEVLTPQKNLPPPFPQRLKSSMKMNSSCILKYFKYVKDIGVSKRGLTEYETAALTEECISRIQNILPKKLKDPGNFTIQITIEQSVHARGLCDLGKSINLMPLSLYQRLCLVSPKRTIVIIQLADRCIARTEGVVADVLLQVGSLIFVVYFVVLHFAPDFEVPFILG
ncbi:hypothetical protein EJD97_024959 [Solanum chilense]|uniref:Aspartic peptidase DDI1-type domain-containing protein n=1 Tax=Solanum chilense TaxID=4083 RepID=A0A6N2C380_SOLCI|nr:hypothetical protein EJD97_024959 [Solanum chilense]